MVREIERDRETEGGKCVICEEVAQTVERVGVHVHFRGGVKARLSSTPATADHEVSRGAPVQMLHPREHPGPGPSPTHAGRLPRELDIVSESPGEL